MRMMRWIPDILRRSRVPASGPTEYYQWFLNFNLAAGVVALPLRNQRTQASLVYIQNDNANLGNLSVGGQNLDINNGIQLAPGQAAVLTADPGPIDVQRMVAGSLGAGLMAHATQLETEEPWIVEGLGNIFSAQGPRVVVDLNQIFVVSNLAAQNVRVTYTQHMRVS